MSTLFDEKGVARSRRISQKLIRINRLKQFAANRGLVGPVALGLAIGKSPSQASDIVSGTASFGEKLARSIEAYAGLPMNWLDGIDADENTAPGPTIHGSVPLLSNVQAGMYKEFVDNFQHGDPTIERHHSIAPVRQHTFALRVVGDSMEPKFQEGMILIVEPEIDANPGDYVIVKNGNDETTFKQLIKDGPDWYLKPLNDRYPIKPLGASTIIGVVRAVELLLR